MIINKDTVAFWIEAVCHGDTFNLQFSDREDIAEGMRYIRIENKDTDTYVFRNFLLSDYPNHSVSLSDIIGKFPDKYPYHKTAGLELIKHEDKINYFK